MEENVIQIKSGIMINADASVKNIIHVKKIIFGILLHVVAKMVDKEGIDKEAKSNNKETKKITKEVNEKTKLVKRNYHCIIDSC